MNNEKLIEALENLIARYMREYGFSCTPIEIVNARIEIANAKVLADQPALYTMDQMRDYADAFHKSRIKEEQPVVVPQGWRLMPDAATPEMLAAGSRWYCFHGSASDLEGMLGDTMDAAPQPPASARITREIFEAALRDMRWSNSHGKERDALEFLRALGLTVEGE